MSSVGEAYTTFTDIPAESDLETSLDGLDSLSSAIRAIDAECDEARYQAYIAEGTEMLNDLRGGGYVLYVRHARTDRSQEDADPIDPADCKTQRNLSEQGRADAANIGEIWKALDIPVSEIMSSEYCRTKETAQAAFGEPTVIPFAELETTLDELLATAPAEGTNTIIVGHVDLLEKVTGIQIPEEVRLNEGDALIYRPIAGGVMGDAGYEMVGRISFRNWADLARIAADIG
jgi:phosphohistidine phosphatase SixA